jgi:hypothetical protein
VILGWVQYTEYLHEIPTGVTSDTDEALEPSSARDVPHAAVVMLAPSLVVAAGVLAICASYPLEAEPELPLDSFTSHVLVLDELPAPDPALFWFDAEPEPEIETPESVTAIVLLDELPALVPSFFDESQDDAQQLSGEAFAQIELAAPAPDTTPPIATAWEDPHDDTEPERTHVQVVAWVEIESAPADGELPPTFWPPEPAESEQTPDSYVGAAEPRDETTEYVSDFGDEVAEPEPVESYAGSIFADAAAPDTTPPVPASFEDAQIDAPDHGAHAQIVLLADPPEPPVEDTTEPLVPVFEQPAAELEVEESVTVQAEFADDAIAFESDFGDEEGEPEPEPSVTAGVFADPPAPEPVPVVGSFAEDAPIPDDVIESLVGLTPFADGTPYVPDDVWSFVSDDQPEIAIDDSTIGLTPFADAPVDAPVLSWISDELLDDDQGAESFVGMPRLEDDQTLPPSFGVVELDDELPVQLESFAVSMLVTDDAVPPPVIRLGRRASIKGDGRHAALVQLEREAAVTQNGRVAQPREE